MANSISKVTGVVKDIKTVGAETDGCDDNMHKYLFYFLLNFHCSNISFGIFRGFKLALGYISFAKERKVELY